MPHTKPLLWELRAPPPPLKRACWRRLLRLLKRIRRDEQVPLAPRVLVQLLHERLRSRYVVLVHLHHQRGRDPQLLAPTDTLVKLALRLADCVADLVRPLLRGQRGDCARGRGGHSAEVTNVRAAGSDVVRVGVRVRACAAPRHHVPHLVERLQPSQPLQQRDRPAEVKGRRVDALLRQAVEDVADELDDLRLRVEGCDGLEHLRGGLLDEDLLRRRQTRRVAPDLRQDEVEGGEAGLELLVVRDKGHQVGEALLVQACLLELVQVRAEHHGVQVLSHVAVPLAHVALLRVQLENRVEQRRNLLLDDACTEALLELVQLPALKLLHQHLVRVRRALGCRGRSCLLLRGGRRGGGGAGRGHELRRRVAGGEPRGGGPRRLCGGAVRRQSGQENPPHDGGG
eukprot:Rhum_TRINITY_DN1248_c0_g2::Rhum_TRINITY_DN1248_c0_g2_i1::g.3706::m.3706